MSSFDTAREKWENYHLRKIKEYEEAAKNGDPEAVENLAYHTNKVNYPTREEIIEMLTFASEAGRETASWKLADYYANWDEEKYHDKIEYYCKIAFASGKTFSDKEPECMHGSIKYWIEKHHPEWCEMEEGFYDDGRYYIHPTNYYGMNVFRGVGKELAIQTKREQEESEVLWRKANEFFERDNEVGFKALLELCENGNPHAAKSVGYCYYTGTVVKRDYQKAIEYYELAIKRGYPAYGELSMIYDAIEEPQKAFEILLIGAKSKDANSYAKLSDKTMHGQIYDGNMYIAAFFASRAFEIDEKEGYMLGILYLNGLFFPKVYPYAKYCIEKSAIDKDYLEECGYEFPDFWDEIEIIKPRYGKFSIRLDRCQEEKDPEKILIEGIELMDGDETDQKKGREKIEFAAERGCCSAMMFAFEYEVDEYEYFLKRGAIEFGNLECIEALTIFNQKKIGSYYKDNPYLEETIKLWNLREKLHGQIEMDNDVLEYYKTFKEKYNAMLNGNK